LDIARLLWKVGFSVNQSGIHHKTRENTKETLIEVITMAYFGKPQKDIRKPKKRFKLYIVQCSECKHKSMVELRRKQKTIQQKCSKCGKTLRMKIVGKVKKLYEKWNSMKIVWF